MSTKKELVFEIWRTSERRCYYLMSAAGTGIGYSLATIAPSQTLVETRFLLSALTCWAISFLLGLQVLKGLQAAIGLSKAIVSNQQEVSMMRPEFQAEVSNLIQNQTESIGSKQSAFQFFQLSLLIAGAFLLIWTKVDILAAIGWTK